MDTAYILFLLVINVVCDGAWLPPGLRGDLPPWGPPVPPPWAVPPPSAVFRRPMDAMVDLTNDLAVAILQDNSHSRSNFAFSPYGLASVLVVLYEGAMGESSRQIHMAGKFPWDRDITRIGFRDIHRHLRSYFSHEGYLSGITLNKERSSLKGEYKRVLRFYGYDVDVEPPKIPLTTTEKPMDQVPLITKPSEVPSRPTVITSIPTTIGSEVTLNASAFPGKESVDDANITEQTLLFPTTDKPVTTQHDKFTLPDMLTEQNKPSASTNLPEVSTVSMITEPAKDNVSPTDPSSPVTVAVDDQTETMSTKTNIIPVETTTRNVLDNGMLVPQSSTLDPLPQTPTASPTSQMEGTTGSEISKEPSQEVTSGITGFNTEKTTLLPDQKSTPEVMTTVFTSDTNIPEETPITTEKSPSPEVTVPIESRIGEEEYPSTTNIDQSTMAVPTSIRDKDATVLEEALMTTEKLNAPEDTESRNTVEEEMESASPINSSSSNDQSTSVSNEKVMTTENLNSLDVTDLIESKIGEDSVSLTSIDESTTVAVPLSTKTQTSTLPEEKSTTTKFVNPTQVTEEDESSASTIVVPSSATDKPSSAPESMTTEKLNQPDVKDFIESRNGEDEESGTSTLLDQSTITAPTSARYKTSTLSEETSINTESGSSTNYDPSTLISMPSSTDQPSTVSEDEFITTEKLIAPDFIESRSGDGEESSSSANLTQSTPMVEPASITDQTTIKSKEKEIENTPETTESRTIEESSTTYKYQSTYKDQSYTENATDVLSTTFKNTNEFFGQSSTNLLPKIINKTPSETTTTRDILITETDSAENLQTNSHTKFLVTESTESNPTGVSGVTQDLLMEESSSSGELQTESYAELSVTETTESKSTAFDSVDQVTTDGTTRRAPVTLSFKPRTKLTTDITTDASILDKELFKRSPEPFEIRTLDEYLLSSDVANKAMQAPVKTFIIPPDKHFVPKTLDEYLLLRDGQVNTEEEEFLPKTLEEYFLSHKKEKAISFKTDLDFKTSKFRRRVRTIADMLHIPSVPDLSLQLQNGMFDSHVSRKAELYRPLPRQPFLVDATSELPVPVMTYSNIFPFAYIPRLHSTAMEFPLDDERYKLLIILPIERRGLRQLTYDLGTVTLRGVLESLRPSKVRATVPTFMVEGFVILTPALQRLGIWNVFDPRRANLSGMSDDPELYVRNVEQSVTVVIRNYVEILDIQTRTMAARGPEHEFSATHPFLYFVLDTETNVSLMAGRMLDPLNSRIY